MVILEFDSIFLFPLVLMVNVLSAAAIFPVVQKQHQLLVTLLLCNAVAMEVNSWIQTIAFKQIWHEDKFVSLTPVGMHTREQPLNREISKQ